MVDSGYDVSGSGSVDPVDVPEALEPPPVALRRRECDDAVDGFGETIREREDYT